MVTRGAVAVSMTPPVEVVVASEKVPVVPGVAGFWIPPSVMVALPAKVTPPLRVTVTVWPLTPTLKVPLGPDAPKKLAPDTSKPAGKADGRRPLLGRELTWKKLM